MPTDIAPVSDFGLAARHAALWASLGAAHRSQGISEVALRLGAGRARDLLAPEQGAVILQSWLAPASVQAGMNVRGLTTAASTWGVAALGMLAGVGFYRLAIGLTVFVVAVELLSMLERRLPTHSAFSSKLKFREGHRARVQEVREYLSVRGLRLPPDDAEVQPSALRDGGADLRQREALGLDERGRHGVVVAPGRRVLRDDALQSRINA